MASMITGDDDGPRMKDRPDQTRPVVGQCADTSFPGRRDRNDSRVPKKLINIDQMGMSVCVKSKKEQKRRSRPANTTEFAGPTRLQETICMDDNDYNPMFLNNAE